MKPEHIPEFLVHVAVNALRGQNMTFEYHSFRQVELLKVSGVVKNINYGNNSSTGMRPTITLELPQNNYVTLEVEAITRSIQ